MEKQSFDRNCSVIYIALGCFPEFIADLAAIAVDSVAYAVEETICLAVDSDLGQILQIFCYIERFVTVFVTELMGKIVTRAHREIINLVLFRIIVRQIYKTIQRSVAAANDQYIAALHLGKNIAVCFGFCHVAIHNFALNQIFDLFYIGAAPFISC